MAGTVVAALPEALIRFGASLGAAEADLRQVAGLAGDDHADIDRFVPIDGTVALWRTLIALHPDAPLGVKFGQMLSWSNMGILGHIIRHSATVGSGLEALGRYQRLLDEALGFALERDGQDGSLSLDHREPTLARGPHLEAIACGIVLGCTTMAGGPLPVSEVHLPGPTPDDPAPYESVFRCPVHFGRDQVRLIFPASCLDQANAMADTGLRKYLEQRASQLLESRPVAEDGDEAWLVEVRKAIAASIAEGNPSAQVVARNLATSVRTLQRRLGQVGTSFADLLQDERRKIAEELLAQSRIPVFEVAFRLGYDDASSFHRAFKRWTGHTPEAYRLNPSLQPA